MKRNYFVVLLICILFFAIGFVSNIFSSINPAIKDSFDLKYAGVALLKFSFWIAYGLLSIPAGVFVERFKEKPALIVAFAFALVGSLVFALQPGYGMAFASLWMIGVCLTMLQVALNPLLRVAGGEEHFAFNLVLVQLIFGAGSTISPIVYQYLVENLGETPANRNMLIEALSRVVPPELSWVSLYWVFALVFFVMLVLVSCVRLPRVDLKEEERVGAWTTHRQLLKNKTVLLFFLGIFAYVGSEQGVGDFISLFLKDYHQINPEGQGAETVAWFWVLFTLGTIMGMIFLKLLDSRMVLIAFALCAMSCLTLALWGSPRMALTCFPLVGLFLSTMWCVVFSLGLNSLDRHHGAFAGILCTGIAGGAIVPLVIGQLADWFGDLRCGMLFLYLTLGYVLGIGFWARPLVTNKTIFSNQEG